MRIGSPLTVPAVGAIISLIGGVLLAGGSAISSYQLKARVVPGPIASAEIPQANATPGPAKPQMAEDVFKNVQVLRGIPVDDFMGTMGVISAALGFCCSDCHTGAGTDKVKWEADTPRKVMARRMILMVAAINRGNFGGRQEVTCWSCHRGHDRPALTPSLDAVYGPEIVYSEDVVTPATGVPSAEQILDKYLQAIGGTQRLGTLKSYTAQGTSIGYAGLGGGAKVEIFAKAPDQRATYIHFDDPARGDSTRTFDGQSGWIATPLTAVRRYPLAGGELDGAKLDAELAFPAQIKQALSRWRVGAPTTLDDRLVQVLQGDGPRGLMATLYFDNASGLLVRLVRYSTSPIGRIPTQVDYSDYRDVEGIKIPFRWTFSWLDGMDAFQLNDVKLNVPIEAIKFGVPPIPAAPTQ
jgi:hypothetical protein